MNWYIKALRNYATFKGRAQRAEYWYFHLFWIIGLFGSIFIGSLLDSVFNQKATIMTIMPILWILVHIIPMIAVQVRRLHDISRSGWWYLINIIPYVGPTVLFIMSVMNSKEDNEYGKNPKNSFDDLE